MSSHLSYCDGWKELLCCAVTGCRMGLFFCGSFLMRIVLPWLTTLSRSQTLVAGSFWLPGVHRMLLVSLTSSCGLCLGLLPSNSSPWTLFDRCLLSGTLLWFQVRQPLLVCLTWCTCHCSLWFMLFMFYPSISRMIVAAAYISSLFSVMFSVGIVSSATLKYFTRDES